MSKYSPEEYTRKIDYEVREISREEATDLVQANHYSPVMPQLTKHWLGIFRENRLVGVTTLGWGTQPKHTIQKILMLGKETEELDARNYYEIGKMCMLESEIKNAETQMITKVIDWIKKHNLERNKDIIAENKLIRKQNWVNKGVPSWEPVAEIPLNPEVKFLYTLADGIMGKCGYVYQAANFYYGGEYWTESYMSSKGEKVHPRTTNQMCKDEWAWRYDARSAGYDEEFRNEFDRKAIQKKRDFEISLRESLHNLPEGLEEKKVESAYQFATDFVKGKRRFKEDMEKFRKSGGLFGERPRERDYMPDSPSGMSKYLPKPKEDYVKKQQVFWLGGKFMDKLGMKMISGKMFRYIFPIDREAKNILADFNSAVLRKKRKIQEASNVYEWERAFVSASKKKNHLNHELACAYVATMKDKPKKPNVYQGPDVWKIGKGVYPKQEDLCWREKVYDDKTGKSSYKELEGMPGWNLSVVEHNKRNVNKHKKGKVC